MAATLRSRSFVLRPFRKGDEASLQRNINNRKIYRYTGLIPYPYTMKHANAWIKSSLREHKRMKPSEIRFAIDSGGEVIGGISLRNIEGHKAEIGYWLSEKYWGRGIMTKAVKLVCGFGFGKLRLRRIYATLFSNNRASARVLEKAGFKREGLLRKLHKKDGRLVDALMYAKVR